MRSAMALHQRCDVYAKLVRHPRLVVPATQLLGGDLYNPTGQGERQGGVLGRCLAMALRFRDPSRGGRCAGTAGAEPPSSFSTR